MTIERNLSHEQLATHPDLLVVLGKNIGVRSSPEGIRNREDHLSNDSRMSAVAAGLLYQPGMKILFSTGKTAGEDTPSESSAMRDYMLARFPEISADDVWLEEKSIDTAGNAQEVHKFLANREERYQHIGLLSVGYHFPRARKIFNHFGVPIERDFAAEEVIRDLGSDEKAKAFVGRWSRLRRVRTEKIKEKIGNILLDADPDGQWIRRVTQRSRK